MEAERLKELLNAVPGLSLSLNHSILILGESVSGVHQQNLQHAGSDIEDLIHYLPSGLPTSIAGLELPGVSEWVKHRDAVTDAFPEALIRRNMTGALKLFRDLRDWAIAHPHHAGCVPALDSLSRLAAGLANVDAESIIEVFNDVERVLKYRGDFNLLLRFGHLIEVAFSNVSHRNKRMTELRTQASTCAVAWVYQRTGRLRDAEAILDRDEELNAAADETRGLAFTIKCRGRLRRIMAERSDYAPSRERRDELLELSTRDLNEARRTFQMIRDSDRVAQVCDCDALLARTAFVAGDLGVARVHLENARLFASVAHNKTWLDIRILEDEIEAVSSAQAPLLDGIGFVLSETAHDGFEYSEIRARAHFARAKILGDPSIAASDLDACRSIYDHLGDLNAGAQVKWWEIRRARELPPGVVTMLELQPPAVRVRALHNYEAKYGHLETSASMNRHRDFGDVRWQAEIAEAHRELTIERGMRW
jgi:hypothetical protein